MDIIKAYATKNLCYISKQKMVPFGIVLHSTGANNPNLKRYVDCPDELGINRYGNHWNNPKPGNRLVCVHSFIGYDKNKNIRIAEILPLDICCWGVGGGKNGSYNYDPPHIQIEICEDDLKNEEYYRKCFSIAAEYCADLCDRFGFTSEKIVSHKEAYERGYGSNHGDPEHWMKNYGETMDNFRKQVEDILKSKEKSKFPYLVRITTDSLNIRKGAGINTAKVGVITDRGVYSIVEEREGYGASLWGKLKSGAGWISLDYTELY